MINKRQRKVLDAVHFRGWSLVRNYGGRGAHRAKKLPQFRLTKPGEESIEISTGDGIAALEKRRLIRRSAARFSYFEYELTEAGRDALREAPP